MSYQELEFLQEVHPQNCNLDAEALIKFLAMLHLNSSSSTVPAATATTPPPPATKFPVSSAFHRISKKRRLPSSSIEQKLLSKRTALSPPSTTASPADAKISLPPLQRSFSEPLNYTQTADIPEASTRQDFISKNNDTSTKSASLPPLPPPPLHRTTSTPVPCDYKFLASSVTTPPPRAASASTLSTSPTADQESPNAKRLKRMKERMLEMAEWFHEVASEGDEDAVSEDENNQDDELENGTVESVSVDEVAGGGRVIHFKCPCGKGYEVLRLGDNCYYRRM